VECWWQQLYSGRVPSALSVAVFDVDMDNDLDIVYPAAPFRIEPTPRVMQGSDLIE
jgi:hypothetical protein